MGTVEQARLGGRRSRARGTLLSGSLWFGGGLGAIVACHWAFGTWSTDGPLLVGWGIVACGALRVLAGAFETLRCCRWRFEPRGRPRVPAGGVPVEDPRLLLDMQNLGLEEAASGEAVQRAYRKLAKLWHPDRFHATDLREHAERRMKLLNASYSRMRRDG